MRELEIDKALHLLMDAFSARREQIEGYPDFAESEIESLNALKKKLEGWHKNLRAQQDWLASHTKHDVFLKDVDALKQLVQAEGEILFDIKNATMPALLAETDALIKMEKKIENSRFQHKLMKDAKQMGAL